MEKEITDKGARPPAVGERRGREASGDARCVWTCGSVSSPPPPRQHRAVMAPMVFWVDHLCRGPCWAPWGRGFPAPLVCTPQMPAAPPCVTASISRCHQTYPGGQTTPPKNWWPGSSDTPGASVPPVPRYHPLEKKRSTDFWRNGQMADSRAGIGQVQDEQKFLVTLHNQEVWGAGGRARQKDTGGEEKGKAGILDLYTPCVDLHPATREHP